MFLHCFGEVFGASRFKATARAGAGNRVDEGRNDELVGPQESADEPPHRTTPARRASCCHSSRREANVAFAERGFATTTIQTPAGNTARESRTISRSLRRTRLRTTAPPTFFEVTKPMRAGFSSTPFNTPRSIIFPCCAAPSVLTRRNSEDSVRCAFLGKRRRGGRFVESSAASLRILSSGEGGIRLPCDVQNAHRLSSAGGACAHAGDGGKGWHGHFSCSCVCESRIAVCGCAWLVDKCVLA